MSTQLSVETNDSISKLKKANNIALKATACSLGTAIGGVALSVFSLKESGALDKFGTRMCALGCFASLVPIAATAYLQTKIKKEEKKMQK